MCLVQGQHQSSCQFELLVTAGPSLPSVESVLVFPRVDKLCPLFMDSGLLGSLPWPFPTRQGPGQLAEITLSLSGSLGDCICILACGPSSAVHRPVTP